MRAVADVRRWPGGGYRVIFWQEGFENQPPALGVEDAFTLKGAVKIATRGEAKWTRWLERRAAERPVPVADWREG